MMYGSLAWPIFAVIGVCFIIMMLKQLRERAPLRCPACRAEPEWTGSGSYEEPPVEYRIYKCSCGERLVKETDGPLQRHDDWVPGKPPQRPAKARVR